MREYGICKCMSIQLYVHLRDALYAKLCRICLCICIHACVLVCMCIQSHSRKHMYSPLCMYVRICIIPFMCIHTCTYVPRFVYAYLCLLGDLGHDDVTDWSSPPPTPSDPRTRAPYFLLANVTDALLLMLLSSRSSYAVHPRCPRQFWLCH